jgi:hypothetical protein
MEKGDRRKTHKGRKIIGREMKEWKKKLKTPDRNVCNTPT